MPLEDSTIPVQTTTTDEPVVEGYSIPVLNNVNHFDQQSSYQIAKDFISKQKTNIIEKITLGLFEEGKKLIDVPYKAYTEGITPKEEGRYVRDMTLNMLGTGTAVPVKGGIGLFGGKLAATADTTALKEAERLINKGVYEGDVKKTTGWFKDVDDMMKFEISDDLAKLADNLKPEINYKLGDILEHPDLYKAYPDLKNVDVKFVDTIGERTAGEQQGNTILLNANLINNPKAKTILLHEIQHNIQDIENFARGGSPEQFTKASRIVDNYIYANNLRKRIESFPGNSWNEKESLFRSKFLEAESGDILDLPTFKRSLDLAHEIYRNPTIAKKMDLMVKPYKDVSYPIEYEMYRRLAGEVEARNTSTRMNFTPEQRRDIPPALTKDVATNEIIGLGK